MTYHEVGRSHLSLLRSVHQRDFNRRVTSSKGYPMLNCDVKNQSIRENLLVRPTCQQQQLRQTSPFVRSCASQHETRPLRVILERAATESRSRPGDGRRENGHGGRGTKKSTFRHRNSRHKPRQGRRSDAKYMSHAWQSIIADLAQFRHVNSQPSRGPSGTITRHTSAPSVGYIPAPRRACKSPQMGFCPIRSSPAGPSPAFRRRRHRSPRESSPSRGLSRSQSPDGVSPPSHLTPAVRDP